MNLIQNLEYSKKLISNAVKNGSWNSYLEILKITKEG
jgi:hypothetical protein